jgi:hypothetical protein
MALVLSLLGLYQVFDGAEYESRVGRKIQPLVLLVAQQVTLEGFHIQPLPFPRGRSSLVATYLKNGQNLVLALLVVPVLILAALPYPGILIVPWHPRRFLGVGKPVDMLVDMLLDLPVGLLDMLADLLVDGQFIYAEFRVDSVLPRRKIQK